jgi:hypothetical protein
VDAPATGADRRRPGLTEGEPVLEKDIIQQKGFRNVGEGEPTGFEVAVRCPYYRGIWASLLERAELTVDGETFGDDQVRWTLAGKAFTSAELADAADARWPFEEPAVLTVDMPGGLEPGVHDVQVAVTWRWSYIPVEMQPTTNVSSRKLVLVG